MKNYKEYLLSTGNKLIFDGSNEEAYIATIDWCGKSIETVFTLDETDPEKADNAVQAFEEVYAKREFFIMLALDRIKEKIIMEAQETQSYEEYASFYRDDPDLYLDMWRFGPFYEILAEMELDMVVFGNEREIRFIFYDYSKDQGYILDGSVEQGFIMVSTNDEFDEYDEFEDD